MYAFKEPDGGITKKDLERVRKKTKIGDKIRYRTIKAFDLQGERFAKYTNGVERIGTVIGKYPHVAVIRYPSGVKEAVRWVELAQRGRR